MASGVGVFKQYQPEYEARGIATFPCGADKQPAIRGYQRLGKPGSRELAARSNANAFGFMVGKRLTIVDVDTPDERTLADALTKYGRTPLVVRSGSGNHQLWYRHNGEGRQIRPNPQEPIDILGGGYVVAPPSKVKGGSYGIIQGSLDDLDRLPSILESANVSRNVGNVIKNVGNVGEGKRNDSLFRHLMREAHHCDTFADLLDVAQGANDDFLPPLPDAEVVKAAKSAWGYTQRGENRFGQKGVWWPKDTANNLIAFDPDGFLLLSFLKANNGPRAQFWITNDGISKTLNWPRQRVSATRARLIDCGFLSCVRPAASNRPAVYRWGEVKQAGKGKVLVKDRCSNSDTPTAPRIIKQLGRLPAASRELADIIKRQSKGAGYVER